MKEYTVEVTVKFLIQANNEAQAEERAVRVEDWVSVAIPKRAKWAEEIETTAEITERPE